MSKKYYSKIDYWILVVYYAAIVGSLIALHKVLFVDSLNIIVTITVALLLATIGVVLPAWMLLDTSYQIKEDKLVIRCGPFCGYIALSSIRVITPTHSVLASPALSLDRLRIEYGKYDCVLVSPREKEEFIAEIKQQQVRLRVA